MDGAVVELMVFRRVDLALEIPAIASLLIFQFLWVWNDLLRRAPRGQLDSAVHGGDPEQLRSSIEHRR